MSAVTRPRADSHSHLFLEEEVELGKRAPVPAKASSLPAASNLPPAERPSSDDDAGSAEEWEARDGGGFELRINS